MRSRAVSMITGVRFTWRSARSSSKPSRPGSIASSTITS
jgi:hypothetical protein